MPTREQLKLFDEKIENYLKERCSGRETWVKVKEVSEILNGSGPRIRRAFWRLHSKGFIKIHRAGPTGFLISYIEKEKRNGCNKEFDREIKSQQRSKKIRETKRKKLEIQLKINENFGKKLREKMRTWYGHKQFKIGGLVYFLIAELERPLNDISDYIIGSIEIIGITTIGYIDFDCHSGVCRVHEVYVQPAYRDNGLGTGLFHYLEEIMNAEGISRIVVGICPEKYGVRDMLHNFYAKNGFSVKQEVTDKEWGIFYKDLEHGREAL